MLIKKILKQLIVKAEIYYESGQGVIKKNYVINEFYEKAKILRVFLSREELSELIELVLKDIKKKL